MTPAALMAVADVDDWAHEEAKRDEGKGRVRPGRMSSNPAADLAELKAL